MLLSVRASCHAQRNKLGISAPAAQSYAHRRLHFLSIKHTTLSGRHGRFGAAAPQAMSHAGVIIVGGGPAGYATAIALAQQGYKDILVLERSPTVDSFEPTKTFTYALYPHGKDVLRDLGMRDIDHAGTRQ